MDRDHLRDSHVGRTLRVGTGNGASLIVNDTRRRVPASPFEPAHELSVEQQSAVGAALRSFHEHLAAAESRIPDSLARLARFDVSRMDRAINICFWGRSGSLLLASYLDNHDDVVSLPMLCGELIYQFHARHEAESLWTKLLTYPFYSERESGVDGSFFSGPFAIRPVDYHAAVLALWHHHREHAADWLQTRQRFVQFLYIAYAIGLGRTSISPSPLIICTQHWPDDSLAAAFASDFPRGRFLHTIRDPIAAVDSWFDRQLAMQTTGVGTARYQSGYSPELADTYLDPALATMIFLLSWDRPHLGTNERSRAVRFEDMHLAPERMMRAVADWMGIEYRPCLLESTFNGAPYVNESGGKRWVGANPANAVRRTGRLFVTDKCVLFILFRDTLAAWGYPGASLPPSRWLRAGLVWMLLMLPMKIELMAAHAIMTRQILPALRRRRFGFAVGGVLHLFLRRIRMMHLLASHAASRPFNARQTLEPL